MISIVILTLNEEADLPKCLESIRSFDDIHVLDSGSNDQTQKIAREAGALVTKNPFKTFGQQRNWALQNLPLKYNWILFLDADEIATEPFIEDLQKSIESAEQATAGYYCTWRLMLDEKWLRRSDAFPKWQFRVLHKDRGEFTDFGHGQKEGKVDGKIEYIQTPYDHYAFSKGWHYWFDRHNRYSIQEAKGRLKVRGNWKKIFSKNTSVRNQNIKSLLGTSWLFPIARFCAPYFLKFGFVEGRAGFIYCFNIAIYEYLVVLKAKELIRNCDRSNKRN
tara:strand:- start:3360 stop:4190 length:831 start_codon:yes stop_codon:yes gene_type:complete